MKYGNVWISCIDDIGKNKNGYFCQVYADEDMGNEIDWFIIHPWDCDCTDEKEVEKFIKEYSKMYQ
jgi:hypothetical protein